MMESLSSTRIVSLDVKECWNTIVRHSNTQDLKSEAQELQYHVSEAYENSRMLKIENWVSKSTRWGMWDIKSYSNNYFSLSVVVRSGLEFTSFCEACRHFFLYFFWTRVGSPPWHTSGCNMIEKPTDGRVGVIWTSHGSIGSWSWICPQLDDRKMRELWATLLKDFLNLN